MNNRILHTVHGISMRIIVEHNFLFVEAPSETIPSIFAPEFSRIEIAFITN